MTEAQRAELMKPSRHLIEFRAFAAKHRIAHPGASMNDIQAAYVRAKAQPTMPAAANLRQ
jgi:hypothetical protein